MNEISRPKVLVVGGAGLIGSHTNKALHQDGFDTVVLDNLSSGFKEAVVVGEFVEGDLSDRSLLDTLFLKHEFKAVFHFAAHLDVGESVRNPLKYYQNNVSNTLNLLEAMQHHRVSYFVFSSSAAVYGIPEKIPIPETHKKMPINPYGKTKLMIEEIVHDFEGAYGLKHCNLRYFNAAGGDPEGRIYNYRRKEHNLIPVLLLNTFQNKRSIQIFGDDYPTPDGTCLRDYIHVDDLSRAHVLALRRLLDGAPSSTYNLGNGKGFSVKEVVDATQAITRIPLTIQLEKRRPGDPPVLLADASKARDELGWIPRYPDLESMVSHAWAALQKFPPSR